MEQYHQLLEKYLNEITWTKASPQLKSQDNFDNYIGSNKYATIFCFSQDDGKIIAIKDFGIFYIKNATVEYSLFANNLFSTLAGIHICASVVASDFYFRRGYLPLHGTTVMGDSKVATVIIGNSGSGKSTLATHLIKFQAHDLVADDIAYINGQGMVIPMAPLIKSWGESSLSNGESLVEEVYKGSGKYIELLPQNVTVQVRAQRLIILENSNDIDVPIISKLDFKQALIALSEHIHHKYLYSY